MGQAFLLALFVIDKEDAESRTGVFMIDASKGYIKDGNKNRLREQDIHEIVDAFNNQIEVPRYSRMVPITEISNPKNDYNLNISRYIDSQEEEDLQDIEAHLLGGIPAKDVEDLAAYWSVCPSLKEALFTPSERPEYFNLKVKKTNIKSTIFENSEFTGYSKKVESTFNGWQEEIKSLLNNLQIGSKPKELITILSEKLISSFGKNALIDKYDVYQKLMDYWFETMQDDAYLISTNGWKAELNVTKNSKGKDTEWTCDLIPKKVLIAKFFVKAQETINDLMVEAETIGQQMETLKEENTGEDDLFAEVKNDADKIAKPDLIKRIRNINAKSEFVDELKVLEEYLGLIQKNAEINSKIKSVELDLDKKLQIKCKNLTLEETKSLVVEDKWLKSMHDSVKNEVERISQKLAGRIKELAERYESPMPKLTKEVEEHSKNVDNHLRNMGFEWVCQ
jgi:type I restriction enzyme M protein